jgi:hypothetical protein
MNYNSYNQNNKNTKYNTNKENFSKSLSNTKNSGIEQEFKPKSYNGIFIVLLTILYILFINKLAEMLSSSSEEDNKISSYVMTVYFISIMSLVIAFIWITRENNGNYVLRKSLTYGSLTMLIYSVLNYWEYLDDYAKLIMLALSISCIIYYAY